MCLRHYVYRVMTDQSRGGSLDFFLRGLLSLFSAVFFSLLMIRKGVYRCGLQQRRRLPVVVVSIGNLTLGGSGKTPLVAALASWALARGKRVAILTRGYVPAVSKKGGDVISDEAQMLTAAVPSAPVLIGKNRFKTAQDFYQKNPVDLFILDDGFQHWRLQRDFDIVVIDSTNPFGNKRLLPRGILREPLSALSRADCFLLSKSDWGKDNIPAIRTVLRQYNPQALCVESFHKPSALKSLFTAHPVDFATLRSRRVCALSAIGDPAGFLAALRGLGAVVDKEKIYFDHYGYGRRDIEQIIGECQSAGITTIVTTAKDAVKLKPFAELFARSCEIFILHIQMEFTYGHEELFARLDSLFHR